MADYTSDRVITQIAVSSCEESVDVVYALCNDGTVWEQPQGCSRKWDRLPRIPQPGEDA